MIHETLKDMRAACGLSIDEAAAAIGVHGNSLRRWESGKDKPRMKRVDAIAEAYGVDRDDVLMAIGIEPTEAHRLESTQHQRISAENRKPQDNNQLGVLGVSLTANGRFAARIRYQGELHYLGTFDTLRDAKVARAFAEKLLFDTAIGAYKEPGEAASAKPPGE